MERPARKSQEVKVTLDTAVLTPNYLKPRTGANRVELTEWKQMKPYVSRKQDGKADTCCQEVNGETITKVFFDLDGEAETQAEAEAMTQSYVEWATAENGVLAGCCAR